MQKMNNRDLGDDGSDHKYNKTCRTVSIFMAEDFYPKMEVAGSPRIFGTNCETS
jgi:hypothetical protein